MDAYAGIILNNQAQDQSKQAAGQDNQTQKQSESDKKEKPESPEEAKPAEGESDKKPTEKKESNEAKAGQPPKKEGMDAAGSPQAGEGQPQNPEEGSEVDYSFKHHYAAIKVLDSMYFLVDDILNNQSVESKKYIQLHNLYQAQQEKLVKEAKQKL